MSADGPRVPRSSNTAALLNLLQQGAASQSEIAEHLDLNQASVSRIIQSLIAVGLVRARPGSSQGRGRPTTRFEVDPTSRSAIGVHLGRNKVHVGVTDLQGWCQFLVTEPRECESPERTLRQVAALVRRVSQHAPATIVGVGITATGEVDSRLGTIRSNLSLGWQDVQVVEPLTLELELPVTLDGVVRNVLAAELAYGSVGRDERALLVLSGDIVECGYTIPRSGILTRIVRGDLSHFMVPGLHRDRYGSLGEVGCNRILLSEAAARGLSVRTVPALLRAAREGHPVATDLLAARLRQITVAVRALADVLHPDVVILGGLTAGFPGSLDAVRAALADRFEPSAVRLPRAHDAPLISAPAALAIREALRLGTLGSMEQSA